MKKLILFAFILTTTAALAQTEEQNPKDLWTHDIDVTLGDNWRQKTISVPGKGEPNVVDFFRAFAKAYPCEYHNLLAMAIDGDDEVMFDQKKPSIYIDKDSCLLENGSFAMRVFYDSHQPVALGVCCHKALLTKLQDAYYYLYDKSSRKLTPFAQGSDYTGGIVKRKTTFYPGKQNNEAAMIHRRSRCGIDGYLVWRLDKFILRDRTKRNFQLSERASTMSLLWKFLYVIDMELREPEPSTNEFGGSILSLPNCIAVITKKADNYTSARAMEGDYNFYARGWERADSIMIVAVYTECAPKFDYDWNQKTEGGDYVKTPHHLAPGDEVSLSFYYCEDSTAVYLDPAIPIFMDVVGKDFPNLEHNEWRCVLSPDNEDLIFVNEADGQQKVFKWDGETLKEQ